MAERWDGTSWQIQATPSLRRGAMSQLIGVSCTSASGCISVGCSSADIFNNQTRATLAERWDGSAWQVQHTPGPPSAAASNL